MCDEFYMYRRSLPDNQANTNGMDDYFDGIGYKLLVNKYGEENLKWDVFISASTDGFAVFKNKRYTLWGLVAINFNLPPSVRYMPQNVIPLAFISGPNQPNDLQSFSRPFIRELLSTLTEGGKIFRFHDGTRKRVRVHIIAFGGDQPAVSKVSGLKGNNAIAPCRDCLIHGISSNHYYYPSKILTNVGSSSPQVRYDIRNLPLRTVRGNKTVLATMNNLSGQERIEWQKKYGVREDSILFKIPSLEPYQSFPHDIMHLFYHIQRELLSIILGDLDDEFNIPNVLVQQLDADLLSWRLGISGQLAPPPRAISKFREWKAVEHKRFSISYAVILFQGVLPSAYLEGLGIFAELMDISTRSYISHGDVERVRTLSHMFFEHFEESYFRYRESRLYMCKSVFHILLHLSSHMKRYGPLIGFSQFWVEGYIRWTMERLKARNRAAQSMFRGALFSESLKLVTRSVSLRNDSLFSKVSELGGFKMLDPSRSMDVRDMSDGGVRLKQLFSDYLRRKFEDMTDEISRDVSQKLSTCLFKAPVRFIVGTDTQTASVFLTLGGSAQRKQDSRACHFVAVEMDEDESTSDTYYGRLLRLIELDLSDSAPYSHPWFCRYTLGVFDWAHDMRIGPQEQVYYDGRSGTVFQGSTIEDVTILRRLIGVVPHRVPRRKRSGTKLRTYFIDDHARMEGILLPNIQSADGVNRRLRETIPEEPIDEWSMNCCTRKFYASFIGDLSLKMIRRCPHTTQYAVQLHHPAFCWPHAPGFAPHFQAPVPRGQARRVGNTPLLGGERVTDCDCFEGKGGRGSRDGAGDVSRLRHWTTIGDRRNRMEDA